MPVDDPLDDGKADAGSLEVTRAVQALEDAEKILRIFHVKSRPIVPHEINQFKRMAAAADFDHGALARAA